jgi:hypothetical protein
MAERLNTRPTLKFGFHLLAFTQQLLIPVQSGNAEKLGIF